MSFIKTPDNKIPLFNGGSENDLSHIDKYLKDVKTNKKVIAGGIFRAKSKIKLFTLMLKSSVKSFQRTINLVPFLSNIILMVLK